MDRAAQIEQEWQKAQKVARHRSCRRSNLPLGRAEPNDSDTWTTPEPTFDALNQIFEFDLDPCCYATTATCPNYYTLQEDGLKCPWFGTVFCNPPFSKKNIPLWAAKAMRECVDRSVIVVILVRHAGDTKWWKNHVARANVDILYPAGRIRFGGVKKSPPFFSPILIFWPPWLLDETTAPLRPWQERQQIIYKRFQDWTRGWVQQRTFNAPRNAIPLC